MAGGYDVQQDAMAKGAAAVDEAGTLVRQHMQTLDSEIQTMFGGWTSGAQRSLGNLHANWVAQQQKLLTALQEMHGALVQTKQTYAAQEESQTSQFDSIAGQL
ncbi:MAG TPA: WXG100 family type VII secretion target [Mycobacteriales bacterium]|nr:WXG100 family type VII secretion target [Mycobacteriales bacterium]